MSTKLTYCNGAYRRPLMACMTPPSCTVPVIALNYMSIKGLYHHHCVSRFLGAGSSAREQADHMRSPTARLIPAQTYNAPLILNPKPDAPRWMSVMYSSSPSASPMLQLNGVENRKLRRIAAIVRNIRKSIAGPSSRWPSTASRACCRSHRSCISWRHDSVYIGRVSSGIGGQSRVHVRSFAD